MLKTEEALAVMLSAQDYDPELAERYGWINRALPGGCARRFRQVTGSSDRQFSGRRPRCSQGSGQCNCTRVDRGVPQRLNLFDDGVRDPRAQGRIGAALRRGFQTRETELTLARMLGDLDR